MVGRLDRETRDQYILEIKAVDGGVPISKQVCTLLTTSEML